MERKVIAIDGPAGSGKSTVSKLAAKKLGFLYIDTGAMYRALTLKAMNEGADLKDEAGLIAMAKNARIELKTGNNDSVCVLLDGKDVSKEIRTPELTKNIKYIARVKGVRQVMVDLQRKVAEEKNAVLEGRDIGTVVFPETPHKFYLDASVEERVRRRYKEFLEKGINIAEAEIKRDVKTRDETDMTRDAGALKKAENAVVIDTTHLSVDEVVDEILKRIK